MNLVDKMELYLGGKNAQLTDERMQVPPTRKPPERPRGGDGDGLPKIPSLMSSQVDEVLSQPPSWLIRWGTTLFFGVLAMSFWVAWLIEYPDIVKSKMVVVATNLPKTINVRQEGRLEKLFVQDGQQVNEGTTIAFFESTAAHDEVLQLEKEINILVNLIAKNQTNQLYGRNVNLYFSLGELQRSYQQFQDAFARSKAYAQNGSVNKKKSVVQNEIGSLQNLNQSTIQQLQLQEKDLVLALEEYKTQENLAEKGLVSKQDARNAYSRFLQKKQSFEQAKTGIETNKIQQSQKKQEVFDIEKSIFEQENTTIQAINSLKADIEAWKQKYIALAPAAGKIVFNETFQENQQLKLGQELCYIMPEKTSIKGEMMVGQYNLGKLKIGQEVLTKFPSYPFQEFGLVKGKVVKIAEIPKDTTYKIDIVFPEGLKTNANKTLTFKNGMTATGEIITADRRLLERFFENLRSQFSRK